MHNTIISARAISFGYTRKTPLFDDLTLSLESGHIYGLLGKNGAGKTSLLKILCGLLYPRKGALAVLGFPPSKREAAFLKNIFLIPENFFLPDTKSAAFIDNYAPFYPNFDRALFKKLTEEFAVNNNTPLKSLSYGQKKKFLICFGLAARTPLLLMDEPTNGLDIPAKTIFRKNSAAALDANSSIIISTHQVREMENLIDQVIILENGKILFDLPLTTIFKKLNAKKCLEPDEIKDYFYKEVTPAGFRVLTPNRDGYETQIDMEFLFNAFLEESSKIKAFLNKTNN